MLPFREWLPVVSPAWQWDVPHLRYIQQQLQRVTDGEVDRMAFLLPPRHGKSESVTVRYAAWRLERNPEMHIVVGAYNQFLANKFSRKIRRIVSGRIPLSRERIAVEEWETLQGGGLRAVGIGGGITGQGADLAIIDDPVKSREEAESEVYRERLWEWYTDDLYTRLEPAAAIILIQTRWHHDDLAGRILASEEKHQWTVVSLPAEAEVGDPLGRAEGVALWPERYNAEALADRKSVLGREYVALYQQRPTQRAGGIIKLAWFRRYHTPPAQPIRIVQSWDTANKAKELNDPWVCTTWAESETGYYLLDCYRKRMEYPEGKRAAKSLAEKWNPSAILIEDKSSGTSLIQDLRLETKLPVLSIEPEGDKVTRMSVETPTIEAGRVWLPESAPWLLDYESELSGFPNAATDDQVDSTSQFLHWIRVRPTPPQYQQVSQREVRFERGAW